MMGRYKIDKFPGVYGYNSTRIKVNGRPDVCYSISYKVGRKKIWEKIGWKSEGYSSVVASELRAIRVRDVRHGNQVKTAAQIRVDKQQQDQTLDFVKNVYFDSEKGQTLKGRKTDLNRYDIHLEKRFGKRRISSLAIKDIDNLKLEIKDKAPATVNNVLELLRRLINFGSKRGLCPELEFVIEMKKIDNEVTEYLTAEEMHRFLEVLDSWPQQEAPRMLRLAWLTGMRRGEIFKLKLENIDFEQKIITIKDPKGGKTAHVFMSEPVVKVLELQINYITQSTSDILYVFPGVGGKQRVDCSAVDRIKAAAKLPKLFRPFHGLRHHLAVTLASSGEYTIDMIGELLTHKNSAITKRYAKFLPDAKKRAAARASELLQGQ